MILRPSSPCRRRGLPRLSVTLPPCQQTRTIYRKSKSSPERPQRDYVLCMLPRVHGAVYTGIRRWSIPAARPICDCLDPSLLLAPSWPPNPCTARAFDHTFYTTLRERLSGFDCPPSSRHLLLGPVQVLGCPPLMPFWPRMSLFYVTLSRRLLPVSLLSPTPAGLSVHRRAVAIAPLHCRSWEDWPCSALFFPFLFGPHPHPSSRSVRLPHTSEKRVSNFAADRTGNASSPS